MKLVHKNSEGVLDQRISIVKKEIPCLDSSWHYHAQYELLYISKSNGIRFVGDSVSQFFPGDLVLVGPHVPHLWRNDPSYYSEQNPGSVRTIILKFTRDFLGKETFDHPEFSGIRQLLEQSRYGVSFEPSVSEELHSALLEIVNLSPAEQSIKLLEILFRLSVVSGSRVLSSTDMRQDTSENAERLDAVIKYISDNYPDYIRLDDVAEVACMTTNSFCRYFKKKTNKSFTQFLNEVRIRNASRMLIQNKLPISEIGYAVGYKSITNFNRQFKQIMGTTPKAFSESI